MAVDVTRVAIVISFAALAGCAVGPGARESGSASIRGAAEHQVLGAIANDAQPEQEFSYRIGWSDLDADGVDEAVVMLFGNDWCGTGGCTVFVVDRDAASWKVVSSVVASRPPIAALATGANGWRDLVVTEVGGGRLEPRRTVLRFEKDGYVKRPELEASGRQETLIGSF